MTALAFALSLPAWGAERESIREEIAVRAEAPAGPAVIAPAPRAGRPVTDEAIRALDLESFERRARPAARLAPGLKRLKRPFPEPPYLSLSPRAVVARYDRWAFEVFCADQLVRREDGDGRLAQRLDWDGSGEGTSPAVRVDAPCRFRFTGWDGPASFTLESEPIVLASLALKEFLGDTRLEVSNAVLFEPGKAAISSQGKSYLDALSDRMRRAPVRAEESYKLTLYHDTPQGKLARARAVALQRLLAKALVINPRRVEVSVLAVDTRGAVLSCLLPAERGAAIGTGIE